jgi:hypothetical protein
VLELTSNAEEYIRARDLRGEVWAWDREGERGKRAPVFGAFCERADIDLLRPAFDIEPILLRFFNARSIRLDIPNPTPSRVYLEPVAGSPPSLPASMGGETERIASPEEVRETFRKLREQAAKKHQPPEPSPNGRKD